MIIDVHCDLLYQLWKHDYDINISESLQFNLSKWRKSRVKVQAFAIFVPDSIPEVKQYDVALEMVQIFYEKIIYPNPEIVQIKTRADLVNLDANQLGAILTLEGCHPIGMDVSKLAKLIDYGVRLVGLTWNNNNPLADSITSLRGQGVSEFGQEVIQLLNEQSIWTDVSHLSVNGFYDVIEQADNVIASHSNAFTICQHPRNLTDEQIDHLIKRNGLIGVTFVPEFTKASTRVTIDDLFLHIDYFLKMGAANQLCFGSDFDGITNVIAGLEDVTGYDDLEKQLKAHYSVSTVQKISATNFINRFPKLA